MDLGRHDLHAAPPGLRSLPGAARLPGLCRGLAEALPYREAKGERPVRRGATFVAIRADGAVLLRERPLHGLLGGMLETPSSPWAEAEPAGKSARGYAPVAADWRKLPGLVEHTFTHFHLELSVYRAEVGQDAQPKRAAEPERCRWLKPRAACRRRAAVGDAEGVAARARRAARQPCGSSFARAASRKASIGLRRPSAS